MDAGNTNGLVIRNHHPRGGSGLPNQGQIDWVALANTTVSASVGFLSRISGAGVDPFTVAVGQAVASKFQMSRLGIHRLENAIKNLQYRSVIGEVLCFGFGMNHMIRSLMHTTEGATCVMLCSILSETRSTVLSARVLFELTSTYSSSSSEAARLTPSLQQWYALVEACAGTLSSTPFGTVVDQMVMLVSHHRSSSPRGGHRRHVGNPRDVASVLNALGRLSLGQIITLTISGGCDCGWIAAVAYWFFDIVVEFRDASGKIISPLGKHTDASRPKLVVVQASTGSTALQATGEAYTVADITTEIIARDQPRGEMPINANDLQSRVPWQSILHQTFGKQASTLLRLKVDFGTAVGSASRMFLEFAKPLVDVSAFLPLNGWHGHGAASYGPGFLHFICARFPEIASSRDIMETSSQRSFSEAVAAYQSTQARLRSTCECHLCRDGVKKISDPGLRGQNLCLVTLCAFVIRLALDLSITSVPPSLLPTRSGLEELYRMYAEERRTESKEDAASDPLFLNSFSKAWDLIPVLFTGFESNRSASLDTLAYVTNGLCAYLGVLHKLSAKPEGMLRIYLIPRCIETRAGRLYATLNDTAQFRVPVFNFNASPAVPCLTMPTVPQPFEEKYEVSAVVEESLSNLTTHFILKKSLNQSVVCSPSSLLSEMQEACQANKVSCPRRDCPALDITSLSVATIEGEGEFKDESLDTVGCKIGLRMVGGDPVARLIALLLDRTYRKDNSAQSQSRSRTNEVRSDGWLDYGDPDTRHIYDDGEVLESEHAETDQLHTQGEAEERTSSPYTLLHPFVMLQGDECLPCTIRKAVAVSGTTHHNVYIVCR
ncbi:MAG: hypothetical protein Q9196_001895 [Gyalolechia fulgens]